MEELVWQSGEGADLKRLAERDDLLNVVNLSPTGNELIRATFQANRVPPSMRRSAARHERSKVLALSPGYNIAHLKTPNRTERTDPKSPFFAQYQFAKIPRC